MDTKKSLTQELAIVVKRALKVQEADSGAPVSGEVVATVCNVIEAIFIHGLRESYFVRGTVHTANPQPNFWPFVSRFAHRNVLAQIKKLTQIKTDVGRSRAWVRITLNEGVMEHYITALSRDRQSLRTFYHNYAFLRDVDEVDLLVSYMKGMGKLAFDAPVNSSLLNSWTPTPLKLASILTEGGNLRSPMADWPGMLQMDDIAETGDDAVSALEYEGLEDDDGKSAAHSRAIPSSVQRRAMNGPSTSSIGRSFVSDDDAASIISHESIIGNRLSEMMRSAVGFAMRKDESYSRPTSVSGDDAFGKVEDVDDHGLVLNVGDVNSDERTSSGTVETSAQKTDSVEGKAVVVRRHKPTHRRKHSGQLRRIVNADAAGFSRSLEDESPVAKTQLPSTLLTNAEHVATPLKFNDSGHPSPTLRTLSTLREVSVDIVNAELGATDHIIEAISTEAHFNGEKHQLSVAVSLPEMILDSISESFAAVTTNDEQIETTNIALELKDQMVAADVSRTLDESATAQATSNIEFELSTTSSTGGGGGNSLSGREWSTPPAAAEPVRRRSESTVFFERLENNDTSFSTTIRTAILNHQQRTMSSEAFETASSDAEPAQATDAAVASDHFNDTVNEKEMEIGVAIMNDSGVAEPNSCSPSDDFVNITTEQAMNASSEWDAMNAKRLALVTRLAAERGLADQQFRCPTCRRMLGTAFDPYRVCAFDGCYYCYECHRDDQMIIPARMVLSWDCRPMRVCRANRAFLNHIADRPLIRIDQCNPTLYEHCPLMANIHKIRLQLSLVAVYLLTCKETVADDLRKRLWPKEYLYDDVHLYSINDLLAVLGGTLAAHVQSVVDYAIGHVYACRLCMCKGYICELCNHEQAIYPFQTDVVYRCPKCFNCVHDSCVRSRHSSASSAPAPCPKCARREAYERQKAASTSAQPSLVGFDDVT